MHSMTAVAECLVKVLHKECGTAMDFFCHSQPSHSLTRMAKVLNMVKRSTPLPKGLENHMADIGQATWVREVLADCHANQL